MPEHQENLKKKFPLLINDFVETIDQLENTA